MEVQKQDSQPCFFTYVIVTWCPTEKIEIRLLLFPVRELTIASRQSKECGSEWRPTDVGTLGTHSGRLTREGRRLKPNDWLGP